MAKTNAQKQSDFKARKEKANEKRKEYWATEAQHVKLKRYLKELKDTSGTTDKNILVDEFLRSKS